MAVIYGDVADPAFTQILEQSDLYNDFSFDEVPSYDFSWMNTLHFSTWLLAETNSSTVDDPKQFVLPFQAFI